MNGENQPLGPHQVQTTPWTLVIEVIQKGGDEASSAALERLFQAYKPVAEEFFRKHDGEELAEDLTQAFFESRIVKPWNRRHGRLSIAYDEEEIKKLPSLATELTRRLRPVARYVWSALSEPTQRAIADYHCRKEETKALRASLASELNALIEGPSIYDETRFSGVPLSVESRNLLGRKLDGHWITWLNRSLLGDAFPGHLVKGIGFIYLVERKEGRRFREFLHHALKCFRADYWKTELAERRGGKAAHSSVEGMVESDHEPGSNPPEPPGADHDWHFALRALDLAVERTIRSMEMEASKARDRSKQFKACLLGRMTQKEAVAELRLKEPALTEVAFKVAFHRFKKGVRKYFRLEVMKGVPPDEGEIKGEIEYLISLLTKGP